MKTLLLKRNQRQQIQFHRQALKKCHLQEVVVEDTVEAEVLTEVVRDQPLHTKIDNPITRRKVIILKMVRKRKKEPKDRIDQKDTNVETEKAQ